MLERIKSRIGKALSQRFYKRFPVVMVADGDREINELITGMLKAERIRSISVPDEQRLFEALHQRRAGIRCIVIDARQNSHGTRAEQDLRGMLVAETLRTSNDSDFTRIPFVFITHEEGRDYPLMDSTGVVVTQPFLRRQIVNAVSRAVAEPAIPVVALK